MAADKRDQMRLRFMRMSKQFKWSHELDTNEGPKAVDNSNQADRITTNECNLNISGKLTDNVYDSEATDSDPGIPSPRNTIQSTNTFTSTSTLADDAMVRPKGKDSGDAQQPYDATPLTFQFPDPNANDYSGTNQALQSATTESTPRTNTSTLPSSTNVNSNTLLSNPLNSVPPGASSNMNDAQTMPLLDTTEHNHSISNVFQSSSTSLSLTEANLSKFNESFHDDNPDMNGSNPLNPYSPSHAFVDQGQEAESALSPLKAPSSVSSVLSKHDFTLLEISSSDESTEENGRETLEHRDLHSDTNHANRGMYDIPEFGAGLAGGFHDNSFVDIPSTNFLDRESRTQKYLNVSFEGRIFRSPVHSPQMIGKEAISSKTKRLSTALNGNFLDLCTSDEDSGDDRDDHNVMDDLNKSFSTILGKQFDSPFTTPTAKRRSGEYENGLIRTPKMDTFKRTKVPDFGTMVAVKTKNVIRKRVKNAKLVQSVDVRRMKRNNPRILCDDILSTKQFKKEKEQYSLRFFEKLNRRVFDNNFKLNDNVTYSWCKTLNKTAGDCRLMTRNNQRKAHIRLATKVLDTLEKLKQTFCHELCHAAAWIVHGVRKPPHGPHFKYWYVLSPF